MDRITDSLVDMGYKQGARVFAERLKRKLAKTLCVECKYCIKFQFDTIDAILKEMECE